MNKRKICLIVASEMTVTAFLKSQIVALGKQYDVTLVVNTQRSDFAEANDLPVKVIPLAIERAINLIADMLALYRLVSLFRQQHFDLVHSVTPKAGLLAMLAAKLAGIRFRIHTFTGQVWATREGFSRRMLKSMDRLLAASATHLLADSFSQRAFLIDQAVCRAEKLKVLADGSISGVDTDRFMPDSKARSDIRKQIGVSEKEILLLFLGRLNRDKGVLDLAAAFAKIAVKLPRLHLLFVGPDEGNLQDAVKSTSAEFVQRVHFIDYTDKPESCFAAADIFCLPSYREGFGSVIIEAAACGVPAIGSRIYGISDAIREGQTGLLFEAGNSDQLAKEIEQLATNSTLRSQMGKAAFERARDDFSTKRLVQAWLDYYDGLQ
ncbi:glycosyltransferase [Mariprofundus ferrooxydans]|uniref:glycosyltransferase n=1 Tax=Mariprofundus ferrooxydans TaxID=314344 RepID=UPI0014315775|nr:glycosyltransferase [Mariprofundus ferrooxydans]